MNEDEFATSRDAKKVRRTTSNRSWRLNPILDPMFTEDVPLEDVYVGRLRDKRNISTAIKIISVAFPAFSHLKRCSGLGILLAPLRSKRSENESIRDYAREFEHSNANDRMQTPQEVKNVLVRHGFDLTILNEELEVSKVPARPPKTKRQADACTKIWPVNFHPDPTTESIISGNIFNDEQLNQMEQLMRVTIEAARKYAIGNSTCDGSALIIDPKSGEPLALASSRSDEHPLWHASMLAIDLVAKIQGGGAWNLLDRTKSAATSDDERCETRKTDDTEVNSDRNSIVDRGSRSTGVECSTGRNNTECLVKCKRKDIDRTPLCYPSSLSEIVLPESIPFEDVSKRKSKGNNSNKKMTAKKCEDEENNVSKCLQSSGDSAEAYQPKTGPYLCTNFWIFLLQEPCALCAMALLHSRASRIFYGTKNPSGVLESKTLLHTTPGLNHRYQVWSGILEKDCQIVANEIKMRSANR